MNATKTTGIDAAIRESERLYPTTSQAGAFDGAPHIVWDEERGQLELMDTVGSADLRHADAQELADALAQLDDDDFDDDDFWSIATSFEIAGTNSW